MASRSDYKIILAESWFNRIVISAVALGFVALVVIGGMTIWSVLRVQDQARWVNHTYEVERAVSRFRVLTLQISTARRGYLLANDDRFRTGFERGVQDTLPALAEIRRLTRDNPRQQRNVAIAVDRVGRQIAQLRRSVDMITAGHRREALAEFGADGTTDLAVAVRDSADAMMNEEARLMTLRARRQADASRLFFRILSIAGALLVVVAVSSLWVILRYTRDLTRSRNALRDLNDNLEAAIVDRTADLSRANQEIQRFAYIVSHDLRSPLVNVMGFTAELETATGVLRELVDKVDAEAPALASADARLAAHEDLPEAIGFIRSSTQKMDRLISAILRLSREGRRVIAPERLDMAALFAGIRDSLQHRLTQLGGEIVIQDPLPTIVSDRVAMEQIFSNLIENAVKYAQPNVAPRIVISARRDGARFLYDVADNGRGIDPRDHDRVFDLFRRSGVQDQPGEGIGLAHVRALVYRLGGTIQCHSALGEGATFRVSLPAMISGDQGASA